jgi:choice-of-anchor B domain-containing protein
MWVPIGFVFALLAGAVSTAHADPISRNVTLLAHLDNYVTYSACWSYVHSDGREYAVLGTTTGTSIVNVTNPSAPYEVAFIPGLTSQWREMKSYGNYIYISTEAQGGGVQIIKMTDPEHPVLVNTYVTTFNRAHTLTLDAPRALLIANGTRLDAAPTGLRILSLANPESPVEIGAYAVDYVHDSWVKTDTLYASCISSAFERIFDFSDPTSPIDIVSWTYPGARSHSGEKSKNNRYLYVCDEQNYGTMKVFDMANVFAHPIVHIYSANPLAIAHNIHVRQDIGYVAYYTEGVRLLDLRDPALPSSGGITIRIPASPEDSTASGRSRRSRPGRSSRATSRPASTSSEPPPTTGGEGARARPRAEHALGRPRGDRGAAEHQHSNTQGMGAAGLALAPGAYTLRVSKFGYQPLILPVNVSMGSYDSMQVTLQPAPAGSLAGAVRRSTDAVGIPDAVVEPLDTGASATSAAGGSYTFPSISAGTYTFRVDRPGYAPLDRVATIQQGTAHTENFSLLRAAWYDSCDTDKGWSLSTAGDAATDGLWVRAKPVGSSVPGAAPAPRTSAESPFLSSSKPGVLGAVQHPEPEEGGFSEAGPVQPGDDYSPGTGFCFVTANGAPGGDPNVGDVDGGRTTLTTPPLNMSGIDRAHRGIPGLVLHEHTGRARLDTRRGLEQRDHVGGARGRTVRAVPRGSSRSSASRITSCRTAPSGSASSPRTKGSATIVEAAVDDFECPRTPPSCPRPCRSIRSHRLRPCSSARRAPTRRIPPAGAVTIDLRLRSAGPARVRVYDVTGRLVARLWDGTAPAGLLPVLWNGLDLAGRKAGSGVYWLRADAAGETFSRRLVLTR